MLFATVRDIGRYGFCRFARRLARWATSSISTRAPSGRALTPIGRALMGAPSLLLLDEPSVGIAHRLKVEIFQSIREIRQAGTAVLLVEQDARSTLAVAERIYIMEHGHFVREGPAAELADDEGIRQVYLGV